jgi:tRNA(fMet)-specific endonuclease VapC
MERSLLDTDVFSEILRAHDSSIVQNAEAYLSVIGRFTISVITIAELVDGFRRQQRETHIERLLQKLLAENHEVLPLDLDAALIAGRIFGELHRTGQPIGRADPFIAAIAIDNAIPLITGNTKHFERIQALGYDLRLENWR